MDEPGHRARRHTGMNPWRAGCAETRTSGSEGGPRKPTDREAGRAPRSDPYTYVATWAGVAYVCFIVDAFSRMIVGWRVASHMRTSMVLDAMEMARWSRGARLKGLRCHSDAGSQFTSLRWGERLAEIGALPSIGSVGDSFDNALAETVNGYYKAELVRGPTRCGPWKTVADVELATLGWVHWHNTARLHGYLGDIPPAEYEQAFYAAHRTDRPPVGIPS
jgi:putative transposase